MSVIIIVIITSLILTSAQYYWNRNWLGLCITTYSLHIRINRSEVDVTLYIISSLLFVKSLQGRYSVHS